MVAVSRDLERLMTTTAEQSAKPDGRYPYTYACDLVRGWAGYGSDGTKLSRADASEIIGNMADVLGITKEDLAGKLADKFLADDQFRAEQALSALEAFGLILGASQ